MKILKIVVLSIICFCLISNTFGQDTKITNIKFVSGKNTLYGQISIPKDKRNLPLIVFLTGSGNLSYQSAIYKKFLSQTIEKTFQKDFAILYFDKPGVNKSTGEWWNQDFFEQAENALNAVRYAKRKFSIDKSKVIIIGHSQGGWLAQIVASKYPNEINFGISLVGPAVSVLEQFVETENSKYLCQGIDSAVATQKAVEDSYSVWLRSVKSGVTDKDLLHFGIIKGYDPRAEIKRIKIPFLFVFGENDEYVYANESVESLKNLFVKIPQNISTIIIPKADHFFHIKAKCFTGDNESLEFSDALNGAMRNWFKQGLNK